MHNQLPSKEDLEHLGFVDRVPTREEQHAIQMMEYERERLGPYAYFDPELLRLEKIQLAVEQRTPRWQREPVPDWHKQAMERDRIEQFRTYVWGKKNEEIKIEYPETWWDAFKNRWFPEWLLKRFPINYIEWTINSTTLYPLLEIETPDYTHTLVYTRKLNYATTNTRLSKMAT